MKSTTIFAILAVTLTTVLAAPHHQDNSVTIPTIRKTAPVRAELLRAFLKIKAGIKTESNPHNGDREELVQAASKFVETVRGLIFKSKLVESTNVADHYSKALIGLDSLEDLISDLIDATLIVFPEADIDKLISSVPKTIHDIIAAIIHYGEDLAELAEGRSEVEIIQNALNSAKKQVDKEIVKFLLLAPFVKGEKLQALIEKTLASFISIVEDTLTKVQEPASSLIEFLDANNSFIEFDFIIYVYVSFYHILEALGLIIIDPDY